MDGPDNDEPCPTLGERESYSSGPPDRYSWLAREGHPSTRRLGRVTDTRAVPTTTEENVTIPTSDRNLRTMVVAVPMADQDFVRLQERVPDLEIVRVPFEQLEGAIGRADAVVSWDLTPAQVQAARRLKWVHSFAAGVEGVLLPEVVARGIPITNASGVHGPNIAEHVLAMMLAFARCLPRLVRTQTWMAWEDDSVRARVFELNGQTLLVVGLGEIGQGVAERARAFGMRTIGVRRRPELPAPTGFATVAGIDRLPDLLSEADHVALCVPLTARTRGLFDAAMLARCKPGAYLYNIGRGAVVDTAALVQALQEGRLAGAGLDVTEPEPLPADSPLWAMENVLITCHTSGATPRYWDRTLDLLGANIERFRRGEPLLNLVDVVEGY
jgi:phosphoglycerate dehydrogenase-like enzyme